MKEIWKPIENYEQYSISNLGNVYSSKRNRILKPTNTTKGYVQVHLSKNGNVVNAPIHRLVAKAFIANPFNKPQVNHIDGDKHNNRVENLEWRTNSENQKHAIKLGLK